MYCMLYADSTGSSTDAVARRVSFAQITCLLSYCCCDIIHAVLKLTVLLF